MVGQKPLPTLPTPVVLSVDARRHRARLIRHFLSETQGDGIQSRLESWASALEEALDELGRCLSREKWLDGVTKWREQQRVERRRAAKQKIESKDAANLHKVKVHGEGELETRNESADNSQEPAKELPPLPNISPSPGMKQMLLCVSPPGTQFHLPTEDSGFDVVPASIGCNFVTGTYVLQDNETPTILFGTKEGRTLQLVGGTFFLQGVTSLSQHEHLFRVLRLATYVHLAITLEQHLLTDSNIALVYPRPKLPSPSPSAPSGSTTPIPTEDRNRKASASFLPSSILSLFSPKTIMGHRSKTIMPILGREVNHIPSAPTTVPRPSLDTGSGIGSFRFSILGSVSGTKQTPTEAEAQIESNTPFTDTLKQMETNAGLLSTSPGVRFDPPSLIVDLASREKETTRRLRGDERTGLTSILGWEGKEHTGRGMIGLLGFLRQQGIEVLRSISVLCGASAGEHPSGDRAACGRAEWRTYRYYAGEEGDDVSLGATIKDLVDFAGAQCTTTGCQYPRGLHETRLIHGGIMISVNVVEKNDGFFNSSSYENGEQVSGVDDVEMWESCKVCEVQSARRRMSDGTYLLSFGKYLELLIYSPTLGLPRSPLCAHTDRLQLRRHFGTSTHTVSFSCTAVEDIFELRVPRLQVTRGERVSSESTPPDLQRGDEEDGGGEEEQEKRKLRIEIKRWWEGVADYMDKLETMFMEDDSLDTFVRFKSKALPRLPSTDEHYANFGRISALRDSPFPGMPPPTTPPGGNQPLPDNNSVHETPSHAPAPPPTPMQETPPPPSHPVAEEDRQQSFLRLSSLRHTFHRTEQSLYAQLGRTRGAVLNDVRCSFMASARGAEKRLCAWQKKHLAGAKIGKGGKETHEDMVWTGAEEPEWWKTGHHALPGSNVIVREGDWGSIIAYTLSTADYQRELTHISITRQISASQSPPQPPPIDASPPAMSNHSSFFSTAMNYRLFTSSTDVQPDPDHDDVTWSAPELFSAVVSRKEHPRDPANSLLSLREVLRQQQKSPAPDSSRFGSLGRGPAPPSAWAKPEVQISRDEADGVVSAEGSDTAGKILQEFESIATGETSRPMSRASESVITLMNNNPPLIEKNIQSGKAVSIMSAESDVTIGKDKHATDTLKPSIAPPPPPKDEEHALRPRDVSNATTASSFASSLTSGLSNAMRFVLHSAAGNLDDTSRPASPYYKAHHGLLSLDTGIDERPHIKYDWTIGKRLKFSCTVYYAKQFDLLRRRCAVDDIYIKSLQHSTNWAADGGKSRSNFWKTSDERFIIKTLVDAWNVADLQVLIDLAPSYFRYIDATANKATVLAKMMGFYTIEIRNLETGVVQSKADLLVMENLFYNQKVVRTFDLKGIQGRKVKPSSGVKVAQKTQTLFDGEWIEGQQKALMLVRPHSKQILRAAIRSDAEFLARSNIMDYSLLIGVNEEHKEITCGLVDTIGSYTFAKTLEYKAKQGLNAGKDITVIPPAEYQDRFVNTLEGYFLACPDKWSKPINESKIISDVNLLPSVL